MFDKRRLTMPTTLQYPIPGHSEGIVLNKQSTKVLTRDGKTQYKGGETVRFKIQDQKAIDPQSVVFNFNVHTDRPRLSIDDWAGSIFRTISIAFNSSQIERMDYYNRVHNCLSSFTVDEGYRNSIWGQMEGYYGKVQGVYGNLGMNIYTQNEYVIDATNSTFQFVVNTDDNLSPFTYTATIAAADYKQYTAAALQPVLQAAIQAAAGVDRNNNVVAAPAGSTMTQSNQIWTFTPGTITAQIPGTAITSHYIVYGNLMSQLGYSGTLIVGANPSVSLGKTVEAFPVFETIDDDAFPNVTTEKQYGGFLNAAWKIKKYSGSRGGIDHTVSRQYSVHFDLSGLFGRYRKLFWLPLVNSIDIEILLEQPKNVLNEWGVAIANDDMYYVQNPSLHMEMYTLSQEYVNALSQSMQEAGLTMAFDTYETHIDTLAQSQSHTQIINTRLSSLKSMYVWFYQPHRDGGDESKRLEKTWMQQRRIVNLAETDIATVDEYQVFIDGRPIQANRIKTTDSQHSEALWELMKSFRIHGDITVTPHVSRDEYQERGLSPSIGKGDNVPNEIYKMFDEQHFLIGVDFEKSDLLSGHSVANQIWLELNWNKAVGPGTQIYTLLHYDKNVIVYPGLVFEERV